MDIIISIGSWLVIISARFIYFICLYGVAIEDIFSLGVEQENESKRYNKVELVGLVLSILGLAWLWSNTLIGLICLIICSVAYSYRETGSEQSDGGAETSNLSRENTNRDWKIFVAVKYIIRCMIGIWWSWSHYKLVLYLSVTAFIVKWVIVSWFRDAGSSKQDNKADIIEENNGEDTNAQNSRHELVNGPLSLICLVLIHSFLFYKAIVFASKNFLCNRWPRRVTIVESIPEIPTLGSPILADHDKEDGSSSSNRILHHTSVYVGGNKSYGGIQIIEGVSFADFMLNIRENGVRDIIFNNFVTQDVRKSSCSVLSFLAYLLVPGLAIYFVHSGVKTTAGTSSLLSNLAQE